MKKIIRLEREGMYTGYPYITHGVIFSREDILEIQRKEDVYGLGVLIMDILLGPGFMESHINQIYQSKNYQEDYDMKIPNELRKDPVITNIVEDCLKPFHERPFIPNIIERLKEWEQQPTPANMEVEFKDIIGSFNLRG